MPCNQHFKAPLSNEIYDAYQKLINAIEHIPQAQRAIKNIPFTAGIVSIADIISYQIGWATLLIGWYQAGITGKMPQMPGDGFDSWDYTGLAQHFYTKYHSDGGKKQLQQFHELVQEIIDIVETEYQSENLEKLGIWHWCTLKSGKQWPLSKWIRVNTVAPYKRAIIIIKQAADIKRKIRN